MGKKIIIAVIALIVIAGIAAGLLIGGLGKPLDTDNTEAVSVTIESGSGTGQIAQTLVDAGIIGSVDEFKLWSRLKKYDSQYKAGTYSLSPSMDYAAIADIIVGGRVQTTDFTIPEGYTIHQTIDTLAAKGLGDKDTFLKLLESDVFDEDYAFLKDAQTGENHLEGYLFPNTYTVAEGMSEEQILRVMLDQFEKDGFAAYDASSSLPAYGGKTPSLNDIITVASIIERECAVDEERPLVASVIYNRLNKGMALQMCSTVQYILGEPKAVLTIADTKIQSPYNTYLNPGLPPGPIASPGLASIKAALNPADTDYLYFVLSEKLDGTSNFSADYNKFLRDKAAYDKAYTAAH